MAVCGRGDGEHTRFPCLAMARYAVAGAVTVFAAAVVVMAIHFVLRSEDIRLSISHGYIEADRLWSLVEAHGSDEVQPIFHASDISQVDVSQVDGDQSQVDKAPGLGSAIGNDKGKRNPMTVTTTSSSSGSGDDISLVILASKKYTTSQPAEQVNLRVILSAANPGSRSRVECHNATVRLRALHAQNLQPIGVAPEIFSFELGNFTVPQQTAHTKHQRAAISNNQTLVYIWNNYRGQTSFDVIVQVDANIISYPVWGTKTVRQTYFCWPVTIGLVPYQTLSRQKDATCLTKEEALLGFDLPPAVAAAPVPAPTTNGSAKLAS